MKRKITVSTPRGVRITATIDSKGGLTRKEVGRIASELADSLLETAASLRWLECPRHKVRVTA